MIEASIKSVQCISPAGLHTMSYKEWGAPDNPNVLVCAHGVTRVADDFDNLARAMASDYRVICPDVVGRGRSGWPGQSPVLPRAAICERHGDPAGARVGQWRAPDSGLVRHLDGRLDRPGLGVVASTARSASGPRHIGPTWRRSLAAHRRTTIGQELRFETFEQGAKSRATCPLSFGPAHGRGNGTNRRWMCCGKDKDGHCAATIHGTGRRRSAWPRRNRRPATKPCCGRACTPCAARLCWCAGRNPICCRTRRPRACWGSRPESGTGGNRRRGPCAHFRP